MTGLEDYSYLVNRKGKSYILIRKMIPVLIRWAQIEAKPHFYSDLAREIGHKSNQIGHQLGLIADVFSELSKITGEKVPSLNSLCISKKDGLPSYGFEYVYKDYGAMKTKQREELAKDTNAKAFMYDKWDWVLQVLKLNPSIVDNAEEVKAIKSGKYGNHSSESDLHKRLKKYVLDHPESIGIKGVVAKEDEHILLSGDRLDVYFKLNNGNQIAVEVKSKISDDADILRGLFQCVKYQSILDAECEMKGENVVNRTLLVLEGNLSDSNFSVRNLFNIDTVEKFEIK